MKYRIGNYLCDVIIERKNNKNTYLRVKENHIIHITTNYFTSKKTIIKLIEDHLSYIEKHLTRLEEKKMSSNQISYLGECYDIIYMPSSQVNFRGYKVYCQNQQQLEQWFQKETASIFQSHLDDLYKQYKEIIPYPKLKIRNMKTRWGVCNRRDNSITLNRQLIEYTLEKLDYVIIHELSHFVYFNHSKEFWLQVEKYCPDYKKIRKSLRS